MANIDILASQELLDAAHARNLTGMLPNVFGPDLARQVATAVEPFIPLTKPLWSSSLGADFMTLAFADGSSLYANGLRLADPMAMSGTATFSSLTYREAGTERELHGAFAASYGIVNGALIITNVHGTATDGVLRIDSGYPAALAAYPGYSGSVVATFQGALVYEASGAVHGDLSNFSGVVGPLQSVTGTLHVNSAYGADGAWHTSVSGVVTSYGAGSGYTSPLVFREIIQGVELPFDSGHPLDESFLADASRFAGNDTISIELGDQVYQTWQVNSGTGDDRIALAGGNGKLHVNAGAGNDRIGALDGSHVIDGGEGTDVFAVNRSSSAYTIEVTQQGILLRSADDANEVQELHNVERLNLNGTRLAFDADGTAGEAYRLYRAAFNREPDKEGLSFWINAMDGGVSLNQVALDFIRSEEFGRLYGGNPSDTAFLTNLYKNVLHRVPDQAGYDFWLDGMAHGTTRASVLQQFSESPENQAQVNSVFLAGVSYDASVLFG